MELLPGSSRVKTLDFLRKYSSVPNDDLFRWCNKPTTKGPTWFAGSFDYSSLQGHAHLSFQRDTKEGPGKEKEKKVLEPPVSSSVSMPGMITANELVHHQRLERLLLCDHGFSHNHEGHADRFREEVWYTMSPLAVVVDSWFVAEIDAPQGSLFSSKRLEKKAPLRGGCYSEREGGGGGGGGRGGDDESTRYGASLAVRAAHKGIMR
ncbi:hypothetical protein HZH66_014529 [Vespula vulgaris]|uniref:Uncharacterized protein n=1 Tax=Vespula vulgaris TaxID=7454 RepID=A0A834J4A1_VESVU|nr:hypothetical protein HZH66_014529 [Vespula vulgaris]